MAGKQFKLSIIVDATTASATKGLGGLAKTVGKLGLAGAAVGTAIVGGLAVAGGAVAKLAIDAAPLEGIQAAFEGITEASGKSSKEMLKALKKGSTGMITQRDLMMKYNLAAQLVGDQFANKLPDAMGFLGKVAAATGEDMSFMMDSLVRGVGRLSPMILDNLGIQVDVTAANEAYAATIGKTVDELSKQEQQTALMNQVMEKLAENTANMPEVAGTAAQGLAALGAKFIDLKDSIGAALLPVLTRLLNLFASLIDKWGPTITKWAEKAGEGIAGLIDEIAVAIEGGWPAIMEKLAEWGRRFWDWLTGPGGAVDNVGISLGTVLAAIGDWITKNWPTIADHLGKWAAGFWEWVDTDVVPFATEKLQAVTDAIQAWAESEEAQAQLAVIGETVGQGLVIGVQALVGAAATWTPIMIEMSAALAKAAIESALPAFKAIAVGLAEGFVTSIADAIGLNLPGAISGAIAKAIAQLGLMAALPGGGLLPFLPGLPGFQFGGTMPGSPSQAGLAVLHGGETVTPAGRGGGVNLTGEAIQLLRTIAGKENIIIVETPDAEAARNHFLNLRDRSSALPAGA